MLKEIFRTSFLYCGPWALMRTLKKRKLGPGISILYGHRVLPDNIIENESDVRRISGHTSASQVVAAIKLLRKYYKIISIDQAISQLSSKDVIEESVVLTFDDGFRDNFKYLYPLLKKLNVPATFYINPSVIGTNKNLWFQSIINFFFAIPEQHYYMEKSQTEYNLSTPEKRFQSAFDFTQYIQANHKPNEFISLIEEVASDMCNPTEIDFHMTWEDLKELVQDPLITIGAHTQNHFPLGYCNDQLSISEISQSINEIESNLGIKVEHFSYPRGHAEDFSQFHIDYLKSNGIHSAVSTIRGVNRGGDDLFKLKRVGFPQEIENGKNDFLWHVGGIPQLVKSIKHRLKVFE